MADIYWIRSEFKQHSPDVEPEKGIDLNGDGVVETGEKPDSNGDAIVDNFEWKNFLGRNEANIRPLGGIFAYYYEEADSLSIDNPIIELLQMESQVAAKGDVRKAYEIVAKIANNIRNDSALNSAKPEEKLLAVYRQIRSHGIAFGKQVGSRFSSSIAGGLLDCDTSSFVVIAVAHEMGWPVWLVDLPGHVFVRWDDGIGTRFNMDFGRTLEDSYYIEEYGVVPKALSDEIYMKKLDLNEMRSRFFSNMGNAKSHLGRHEEAIKDYDESISLDPKNAHAYLNRAVSKGELGRYEEEIEDCNEVIRLDPGNAIAFFNRGNAKSSMGRNEEAIKDYDESIRLDPKNASVFINRGVSKSELGWHEEEMKDYNEAIRVDPKDVHARFNRGVAKADMGQYEEAIEDYNETVRLDSKYTLAYFGRGYAKYKLGRYEEAIKDFSEANSLDPKATDTYIERGFAYFETSQYEKARRDFLKVTQREPWRIDLHFLQILAQFGAI